MAEVHATSSPHIPFQAAAAPGGFHAAWTVAGRELAEQLTSLRFLIIGLLVLGLTPLAIYVGARDYTNRLEDYNRLMAQRQAIRAGRAGRRVRGFDEPWTSENELMVLRVLRPPEVLSVLVRGLDGTMPGYWDFSPYGIETGPAALPSQWLGDILGQIDLEFLIRVVLGLLAILLAFDSVVGEKELGTLRVVLSQPISRSAFISGKLLAGMTTLLIPLLMMFLTALLVAHFLGINLLAADTLAKISLLVVTSAGYLACLYAGGLLISSLTMTQKTSIVILLVTWVVIVLAIPPLATVIARAIAPTPSAQSIEAQKRALDDDMRRQAELAMGTIYREITGLPEGWADTSLYEQHKGAIDRRIIPIQVDYLNKRRQILGEIDRDFERRVSRQRRVARMIMAFSPGAAFANAAADLAGTGDAHRVAWGRAVRRHQSRLSEVLFDDPPTITIRNKGANFTTDRRKPPSITDLPAFTPPRRDVRAAINRALPALGLLLLYTGLFIAGGFIAFSRYDVR